MNKHKNTNDSIDSLLKLYIRRDDPELNDDSDETGGSEGSGGSGRIGGSGDSGRRVISTSYLVDETKTMEREQRLNEQQGHRQLAKVHAREHHEEQRQAAPEGELQNDIAQNPWLNSQRFDGIPPALNPEPPLNSAARREFDNERREQEMEKQLRLGNMPKFSTAPKPQGP